jgi:hypothetical protein
MYGTCVGVGSCSAYKSLWDYSFNISFYEQSNYMLVPLSTFAQTVNNATSGLSSCMIHV